MATSREAIENAKLLNQLTKEQEKTVDSIREKKEYIAKYEKLNHTELVKTAQKELKLLNERMDIQKKEMKLLQGISDIHDDIKATEDKEAMLAFDIAGTKKKIAKAINPVTAI